MSQVQFLYGSKSAYQALSTKSPNTLYFLTDTFEIYKGTDLYTRSYEIFKNSSAVEIQKKIIYTCLQILNNQLFLMVLIINI